MFSKQLPVPLVCQLLSLAHVEEPYASEVGDERSPRLVRITVAFPPIENSAVKNGHSQTSTCSLAKSEPEKVNAFTCDTT